MVIDIINDLYRMRLIQPKQLLEKLIGERLDLALKAYYSDLIYKFKAYDVDNTSIKKLVKDVF